jgi:hypothetical protein
VIFVHVSNGFNALIAVGPHALVNLFGRHNKTFNNFSDIFNIGD